jgi:hypothetical protein
MVKVMTLGGRILLMGGGVITDVSSPIPLDNLVAWYDGADASTITVDGNNRISQWSDKSGNEYHLGQFSTVGTPSYEESGPRINGILVPAFDANALISSTPRPSPNYTIYMVFMALNSGKDAHYLFSLGAAHTRIGSALHYAGGVFHYWGNQGGENLYIPATFGQPHLAVFTYDGTDRSLFVGGSNQTDAPNPFSTTEDHLVIGCDIGDIHGSRMLGGCIAEVGYYNVFHPPQTREEISQTLREKWGLISID